MLNQKTIAMSQIYHFKKNRRDEVADYDTSYCFRSRMGWLQLNKKATTLVELDDCYQVTLADWYMKVEGKYLESVIKRRTQCEELNEEYKESKNG